MASGHKGESVLPRLQSGERGPPDPLPGPRIRDVAGQVALVFELEIGREAGDLAGRQQRQPGHHAKAIDQP